MAEANELLKDSGVPAKPPGKFLPARRFLAWTLFSLICPVALIAVPMPPSYFLLLCMVLSVGAWFILRIGRRMGLGLSFVAAVSISGSYLFILAVIVSIFYLHKMPALDDNASRETPRNGYSRSIAISPPGATTASTNAPGGSS